MFFCCFLSILISSLIRTDAEAEAPVLWPPDVKSRLIRKDPDAEKDGRQEEKWMTEDEMVGWHHWLNGHEFKQAPGGGEGQGSLAGCSPWGHKESDMTKWLNNISFVKSFQEYGDTNMRSILSFSCSVVPYSLWPQGLQHTRLPCPSPPPGVCSNSCPLNQSCHPTIWKDQNGNVIPSLSLFIVTGPMKMAYTFHILLKSFYVITGN